jgi:DNA-binding MarR family transcriptional regulator
VTLNLADLFVQMDQARTSTARSHRLTAIELSAITYVSFSDGVRPSALAARLGVTSGTTTALVDRLEVHGLVVRTPHPDDRRSLLVVATEAGRRVADATAGKLDAIVRDTLAQVSDDATVTTAKVLTLVIDAIAASTAEDAGPPA